MNLGTEIKTKIIILVLVFFAVGSLGLQKVQSQSVDELNQQKSERQKKLDQLNQQIKKFQQEIAETRSKSNTIKNEIFIFDRQIASTELQIEARETQIEDTELQISELEKLIQKKIEEIEKNKEILSDLIVELNEFDRDFILNTVLSLDDFSKIINQIQYTQEFQEQIFDIVQKIKEVKATLEKNQEELKAELENLEELKEQLEITIVELGVQKGQKQILLNQTQGIESNFQKLLAASKEEEENIAQEIEDLDRTIREKLGFKTVPAKKGVLDWPMDGILTQRYGNTGFRALGYDFHNGIDIAAPAGQPIYAAADGEVIHTDSSDAAYGNWVAIKHNISNNGGNSEIITLYAHFRSFKVVPGQKVKKGDLIGFEGNTGNTTKKLYGPKRGYHIHFGVYDSEGFGVKQGSYSHIYGPYKIPFGYTYDPMKFLE